MDPQDAGYTAVQGQQFYNDLLVRVRAISGVQSASVAFTYPSSTAMYSGAVFVEGRPLRPGEAAPAILMNRVAPGYFETLETSILSGRAFRDSDTAAAPRVAVINQTMARQLWPDENAMGKRFHLNRGSEPWIEVVGIARDSKYVSLLANAVPYFYVALAQNYVSFATLLVRTRTAPGALKTSIEEQIHALAPGLPVIDVRTMEHALNSGLTGFYVYRLAADLAAGLGILGLVLAIIGLYGVISYSTTQRTHEIGIRMALGAHPGDIWRVVSPQGLAIVGAGAAIGILAALALTRIMTGLLYGVSAQDPLTYGGVTVLVAAVTLLACYIPARRATKVDPVVALRYE
jgi:putative ABC transport system permease protein